MNNEIEIKRLYIYIIAILFITIICYHFYYQSKFLTIGNINDEKFVELLSDYYQSIKNSDVEKLKTLIDLNAFNKLVGYENTEEEFEEILKNIINEDYYVNINKIKIFNYEIEDDGNISVSYYYKNNYISAYINSEYKLIYISALFNEYTDYHTLKYLEANGL